MPQLSNSAKPIRLSNAVAAGQTTINGASIDLANVEGAYILALFGAITAGAVTSVKLQQSGDDGASDDFSDVAGSNVSVPDTASNKMIGIDTSKATKRYVRPVITRGTQNAAVDAILALTYGARNQPVAKDASLVSLLQLVGAAEGTP